jgi:hypothetical protein
MTVQMVDLTDNLNLSFLQSRKDYGGDGRIKDKADHARNGRMNDDDRRNERV